jgi:hypothetical protein
MTGRVAKASSADLCDLAFAEGEWNSWEQMRVRLGKKVLTSGVHMSVNVDCNPNRDWNFPGVPNRFRV